jgi:hypothetical protein
MFGHCETALLVEAKSVSSTTSPEKFHGQCPGGLTRPNGKVVYCDCHCHEGQDVTPRENVPFHVDKKEETESWVVKLRLDGRIELPAPSDENALTSLRNRVRYFGRSHGLRLRTKVNGDTLIVLVRGDAK